MHQQGPHQPSITNLLYPSNRHTSTKHHYMIFASTSSMISCMWGISWLHPARHNVDWIIESFRKPTKLYGASVGPWSWERKRKQVARISVRSSRMALSIFYDIPRWDVSHDSNGDSWKKIGKWGSWRDVSIETSWETLTTAYLTCTELVNTSLAIWHLTRILI